MRDELRQGTRAAHQRLDDFVAGLKPFDTPDAYNVYLSSMRSLYQTYQPAIDWASKQTDLTSPVSGLLAAIDHDLSDNKSPAGNNHRQASTASTPEQLWAAAYVMEGSAMGARHLIKRLRETDLPNAFMTKLAEDSHERWPKFVQGLEEAECNTVEAVDAANKVFDDIYDCFAQNARRANLVSCGTPGE